MQETGATVIPTAKTRMIVVEGPDGAGKSTLLGNLADNLDRKIIHSGGPPKTPEEWRERVMKFRLMADKPILLDRLPHISEQIYGPLYSRETDRSLTLEVVEMNPIIVFCCLPDIDMMFERISHKPKDHKPSAHLNLVFANYSSIVSRYRQLMIELVSKGAQVIPYAWTTTHYDKFIKEIKQCAE